MEKNFPVFLIVIKYESWKTQEVFQENVKENEILYPGFSIVFLFW